MPDTEPTNGSPTEADAAAAAQQAADAMGAAMASARKLLEDAGQNGFQFAAYQAAVGAMTLTLQNAVAEQQHAHIVRMAVTTAAANAILEGRKTEADEILALATARLASPPLTELMAQIRTCIDSLNQGFHGVKTTPATAAETKPKTKAKSTAAPAAVKTKPPSKSAKRKTPGRRKTAKA